MENKREATKSLEEVTGDNISDLPKR